jgi:hypothetical protein
MERIKVTFVIGLREEEVEALKNDEVVVSKLILMPGDQEIFRYKEGDRIQVESPHGNREWCRIYQLESVTRENQTILIFTLEKAEVEQR